jgi:hypothetical protein
MADSEKQKNTATVSVRPIPSTLVDGDQTPTDSIPASTDKTNPIDPEKDSTSFGVTIEHTKSHLPVPPHPALKVKPSQTTINTDVPPSPNSFSSADEKAITNPFSAFYSHPPCSFERGKTEVNIYQNDIESQCPISTSPKISVERTKDCAMWPSQQELKRRAKMNKKRRRWNPFGRLNRKAKAVVFGVGILLVVGIALAIAIPITLKVGGGVYASPSEPDKPLRGGS